MVDVGPQTEPDLTAAEVSETPRLFFTSQSGAGGQRLQQDLNEIAVIFPDVYNTKQYMFS